MPHAPPAGGLAGLRTLLPFLRPHRGRMIVGALCIVASASLALSAPSFVRRAVNGLVNGISPRTLATYGATILALAAGAGVFLFLVRRLLIGVSRDLEYDLRQDFFERMLAKDPAFFDRSRTGDLMSRAVSDLSAVRMMLGPGIMQLLNTLFTGGGAVILMFRVDPVLALVAVASLPLVALATNLFGGTIHDRFEEIQADFAQLGAFAQENFAGARLVRAFSREEAFVREFEEKNRGFLAKNLGLIRISALFYPSLQLLVALGFVAVLWVGGLRVLSGRLDVGRFVEFHLYLAELVWPSIALGWVLSLFQRASASWKRMEEIRRAPVTLVPGTRPLPGEVRGEIRFDGVGLLGDEGKPLLGPVDLTFRDGETVAIVGRTGAGKSLLLSLAARLRDPSTGRVTFDGVDLRELDTDAFRRAVSLVPQESFLFGDTVAGNIAFGRRSASREEIAAAADAAGLAPDLAGFPKGLDTVVGERGITLSGGQRQRVALARALLVAPPVLLLDDALSAVDTETEARILAGLSRTFGTRTTILVTHRVSTARLADRVVVLDRGRVVEEGTHDELLGTGGLYARLAERQRIEAEIEAEA